MRDRSNIRPVWLLAAITVPVIAAGFMSSLIYESWSMFYLSLVGAALMVVVFPFVVFLGSLVHGIPRATIRLIDCLQRLFTTRR
jgi:hypothetical protein